LAAWAFSEALYAVHEAALGRYSIWGWKNTLIFGRATGTFVPIPINFAHLAAIVLPMALTSPSAWHTAAPAVPHSDADS